MKLFIGAVVEKAKLLVSNSLIKLIQDDETIWQTKNIAAVTTKAEEIPFTESSPSKPDIKKEEGEWGKTFLAYIMASIFGILAFPDSIIFLLFSLIPVIFHRIYKKINRNKEVAKWKRECEKISLIYEEWEKIKNMPVFIYSLEITTNGGTQTMMQSLYNQDIKSSSELIQEAMDGKLNNEKSINSDYKIRFKNTRTLHELKNIEFRKAREQLQKIKIQN